MNFFTDLVNGFLAMTVTIWMLNIATFFILAKTNVALLIALLIPILVLAHEYLKFRGRKEIAQGWDKLKHILIFIYGVCFACWMFDVGSTYYAVDVLGVAAEQNPLGWPLGGLGALAFYVPALTFTYFLLNKIKQRHALVAAVLVTILASYMGIMNLFAGFSNFSFFTYSVVLSLEAFWYLLFIVIAINCICVIAFIKLTKVTRPQ
jgi:hypothetical protein